ncbi:MAG: hypothetical protein AAF709_17005, partial [Pseudomonadota bacterium]
AIGVPRDLYHAIVASGDAARAAMASGAYGRRSTISDQTAITLFLTASRKRIFTKASTSNEWPLNLNPTTDGNSSITTQMKFLPLAQ